MDVGAKGYLKKSNLDTETNALGYMKKTAADGLYQLKTSLDSDVGAKGYLKKSNLDAETNALGYMKKTAADGLYQLKTSLDSDVGAKGYLKNNKVYTGTAWNNTDYPIGKYILCNSPTGIGYVLNNSPSVVPMALAGGFNIDAANVGISSYIQLSGTWRYCGEVPSQLYSSTYLKIVLLCRVL
ncbi:MAG: hypothetical protein FWH53_00515 [Leptospirales bacterium]|nr:hypothetical protein [Leptospirales bacterium]